MSRAAINWNCLFLPISYIIVVDKESKFYQIVLYIDKSIKEFISIHTIFNHTIDTYHQINISGK